MMKILLFLVVLPNLALVNSSLFLNIPNAEDVEWWIPTDIDMPEKCRFDETFLRAMEEFRICIHHLITTQRSSFPEASVAEEYETSVCVYNFLPELEKCLNPQELEIAWRTSRIFYQILSKTIDFINRGGLACWETKKHDIIKHCTKPFFDKYFDNSENPNVSRSLLKILNSRNSKNCQNVIDLQTCLGNHFDECDQTISYAIVALVEIIKKDIGCSNLASRASANVDINNYTFARIALNVIYALVLVKYLS